ncbi:PH-like domain-containing protein [Streptomyces platensis]|uniref:PH-like domain-containing protein n=1 Tax=Streptomyces platensis TaxID=58346 RepID=UPI0036853B27
MTPPLIHLAEAQQSAPVTDWAARISWVVGLLVFVVFVYWLMRQGWKWRGTLQGDLPELPATPDDPGEPELTLSGRYHGSTTAGQWLDRIVARGLGTRSRVELTLSDQGLDVVRPGAADFFVPAAALRGARLDKGIAGKVLPEGGLLIVTWRHGDKEIDSGFRSDRATEHPAWVEAVNRLSTTEHSTTEHSTTEHSTTEHHTSITEHTETEGAR